MKIRFGAAVAVALLLPWLLIGANNAMAQNPERSVPCPGDLDDDYDIDIADLATLLSHYGETGASYEDGDLNGDGNVNVQDLAALLSVYGTTCSRFPTQIELAGDPLDQYPFFDFVKAFNENATVHAAIDPSRNPELVGQTVMLYVVNARTHAEWEADTRLSEVRPGGPQEITITGTTVQDNTFQIAVGYELEGTDGLILGVPYDIVLDVNNDGSLDSGDYIDGARERDEAGFYVMTDPVSNGPLAVTEITYSGGTWLGQNTFYPTNIASMGRLPLIVISHGNGHNYLWYDHIGLHMASWGYVVMSHQNNTVPGIETASTTTLTNTDYFLGNLSTIAGGVMKDHIDTHRITWIGHSRGGEGVARAYDRMYDGTYTPQNFTKEDILLISSMAPTDFLKTPNSNPHGANYHLWTVSADDDVNGGADCDLCQTYHLHDRATGFRQSTTIQGAGHGDLHNGGGSSVATGPCLIGRANTHKIQKGYFLPLIKHYIEGNIPALDFLTRQWEQFRPITAPTGTCIVVSNMYRNSAPAGNFMIDDYQTNSSATVSSSGGTVTYDVTNLTEGRLDDNNTSFTWTTSDPMNGMTLASSESSDDSKGVVFDWYEVDKYYELGVIPEQHDFTAYKYLSFRAGQGTRHPYTTYQLGDLTFSVTLRDTQGVESTINIGAYGGGLEEPYQRSSGWHNELETIRILLTDFLANDAGLDLTDIEAVRFDFGPSFGSTRGRIGLDEVMLTSDNPPNVYLNLSVVGGAPQYIAPGQATTLTVEILESNEQYIEGTAMMHYRLDSGDFIDVAMTDLGGGLFEATLPALVCSDTPEFYFSAEGSASGLIMNPSEGPAGPFAATVGEFVVFYEANMDTNPGWTYQSNWAYGTPTGGGGEHGGPDPTSGYTGPNVFGYDLGGDYENNMTEKHLTTTAIDCSGRDNVYLKYWRWLGVEQPLYDHAYVRVSTNGTTWTNVWTNTTEIADTSWVEDVFDISAYAAGQPTVYIRWTMGTTDSSYIYCGWNIDDMRMESFECD